MRKRNCRVEIYFTKTELENLTKKVRKSGLSREGYCRRILNGAVVKEAPPAELPLLIREVRRVGYNIEIYFPMKNVRYIAVNDCVDTANKNNDIAALKNVINEFYSRDNSRKIRSSIRARRRDCTAVPMPRWGIARPRTTTTSWSWTMKRRGSSSGYSSTPTLAWGRIKSLLTCGKSKSPAPPGGSTPWRKGLFPAVFRPVK